MKTAVKEDRKYAAAISTGGIGTGRFFALNGNHTLGREESRSGRFLEYRDYCKQHIVDHYVKTLLGEKFPVYPVGRIGDDAEGRELFREMEEAGLETDFLKITEQARTLSCICLVYPDGSGGNLTTDQSACSLVSEEDILASRPIFEKYGRNCIALALPEVPLKSRVALLEAAMAVNAFRAASFLSEEMEEVRKGNLLSKLNLLAINIDEAAGLADVPKDQSPEATVSALVAKLSGVYPELMISITAGKCGSWLWSGNETYFQPAMKVDAVNTAGAGDAYLAGLVTGIAAGLNLGDSQILAALTGALSTTVPASIHKGISRESLRNFARKQISLTPELNVFLKSGG